MYIVVTICSRRNLKFDDCATLRRRFAVEYRCSCRRWKSVTRVPRRFCYLSPRPLSVQQEEESPRELYESRVSQNSRTRPGVRENVHTPSGIESLNRRVSTSLECIVTVPVQSV